MKKHAIIPIFIPHNGCPHDCIFCNQKKITARMESPDDETVINTIERNLKTIDEFDDATKEIAFFGGSFTGIPMEDQIRYLSIAQRYKKSKRIDKIRLSTRPDYIDDAILTNLKKHSVDIIELGVQSFDDEVLRLSNRGHDASVVYRSSEAIKDAGFELGIQLMVGLPGDNETKSIYSAKETVNIKPSMARLYPTVVLEDTELKERFEAGLYQPVAEDEMVNRVAKMYEILSDAGIRILRVGLKSTDIINSDSDSIYNDYHPAFRELVEGRIALRKMTKLIDEALRDSHTKSLIFVANPKQISVLAGHKKENRNYLKKNYPHIEIGFREDSSVGIDEYFIQLFEVKD